VGNEWKRTKGESRVTNKKDIAIFWRRDDNNLDYG
jgi:hypothetical protein